MRTVLVKVAKRVARDIAVRSGWAGLHFARQRGRFRVLTYHGLVPDELAGAPWVPLHFVTVSRFERQMAMLADLPAGTVRPLGELAAGLRAACPPDEPAVCLTFDDGTADNVRLALPILTAHGFAATFFLATGYVGGDRLLVNDMLRLLRLVYRGGRLAGPVSPLLHRLLTEPGLNKTVTLGAYRSELESLWDRNAHIIDPAARTALRMMSWDDARALGEAGMEIGAHTVSHVILANEDDDSRRREITDSIAQIQAELGRSEMIFAYPNGQAGDYGQFDMDVLASLGVTAAVTDQPGWNAPTTPLLELRRNCVGLHHSDQAFEAEVFGIYDGKEPLAARAFA